MTAQAEERLQVLNMIEAGKISVDEGFQLLTALESARGAYASEGHALNAPRLKGKWMRLRVSDLHSGHAKAQASLPLRLLEAGLLIGAHYAPELRGLNLPQLREALAHGLEGRILEVDDLEKGVKVEVLVE